jgi:tRNA(Ile)-lysidine synthase
MLHHNMNKAVEEFFQRHCVSPCSVCVAVSGGCDSVALFHVLHAMRPRLGISRIGIAHVNHQLRGKESGDDAVFVRRMARGAGVDFHLKALNKSNRPEKGIEEWARNERYAFFAHLKKFVPYNYIATAHTANDQAETVVLRLLRGTGVHGLCGISPKREDGVIRPLLMVQKVDLKQWLAGKNLTYREDSTNTDTSYTRNRVRHSVIPLLESIEPSAVQHLVAVADNAREAEEIMGPIINKWLSDNVVEMGGKRFFFKKAGLRDQNIADESIAFFFRKKGIVFDRFHIRSIFENYGRSRGQFLLPGGWKYQCKKESLEFLPTGKVRRPERFVVNLKENGFTECKERKCRFSIKKTTHISLKDISFSDQDTAWLDAAKLASGLVFRSWKKGERFWPYGSTRYTGINEFLKKQGMNLEDRATTGVVAEKNGDIVWIPGIRVGYPFRITPLTKTALKISCKRQG